MNERGFLNSMKVAFSGGGNIFIVKILAGAALLGLLEVVKSILGKFCSDNILSCSND